MVFKAPARPIRIVLWWQVIATAVEHVRGRVPVWAGTGAETTREAVRLTRMAEKEGADGVSIITPYFVSPSQQEVHDRGFSSAGSS